METGEQRALTHAHMQPPSTLGEKKTLDSFEAVWAKREFVVGSWQTFDIDVCLFSAFGDYLVCHTTGAGLRYKNCTDCPLMGYPYDAALDPAVIEAHADAIPPVVCGKGILLDLGRQPVGMC